MQVIATIHKGHRIHTEGRVFTVVGSRSVRGVYRYILKDANGQAASMRREDVIAGQQDGSVQVTA